MALFGLFSRCKKQGIVFIAPNAVIKCPGKLNMSKGTTIEAESYIDALSNEGIVLGRNVSVGRYTTIACTGSLRHMDKGFRVGDNVGLGTHGIYGCAGGIEIGDDTIIGNYVTCHAENHNFSLKNIPIRMQGVNHKGIKIGKGCWIGAKATILDGAVIGDHCVIAAGSVVTEGFYPNNTVYGGVPAKQLKSIE